MYNNVIENQYANKFWKIWKFYNGPYLIQKDNSGNLLIQDKILAL